MRLSNGLIGLFLYLLAGLVIWQMQSFPSIPGHYYGPSLLPSLIAGAMAVCGSLLLLRAYRAQEEQMFSFALLHPFNTARAGVSLSLMVTAILAFYFLGDSVGYPILTFFILLFFFVWLRGLKLGPVALALILTIVFDLLFRVLLRVPVPSGLLDGVL